MPIPNPVAFTIFHIDIMWYGILITAGIALATIVCMRRAPKHGLDGDRILNFVIISVPVAIVGARLYYVIFNWSMYAGDLAKIVNIRMGGLAIHGGLIFGPGNGSRTVPDLEDPPAEHPGSGSSVRCSGAGYRKVGELLQF